MTKWPVQIKHLGRGQTPTPLTRGGRFRVDGGRRRHAAHVVAAAKVEPLHPAHAVRQGAAAARTSGTRLGG